MPATFSSVDLAGTGYQGGIATGEISWLPTDNHLSHLTGTLNFFFKGIPGDVDPTPPGPIADELKLVITLVYEGWAPLATTRSSKPVTRKQKSTAAKAKSTTRARRRS